MDKEYRLSNDIGQEVPNLQIVLSICKRRQHTVGHNQLFGNNSRTFKISDDEEFLILQSYFIVLILNKHGETMRKQNNIILQIANKYLYYIFK